MENVYNPAYSYSVTKRILIADDNASIRRAIRSFLLAKAEEMEICGEAVDGLEAVEKAKQLNPDLVLLDFAMPQMNGAEVASILRKKMPRTKIILFTMHSERIGKSLTSAIGVDVVLSKPDGMTEMMRSVRSLLA